MLGRLLVIDDDASMRDVLDVELTRRGFDVVLQASADAGLRELADAEFDVVLTDVNMPSMTGVELCTRIIANREDLPVVLMTAFGSLESSVLAIRAGAYDFITKPFSIEELVLMLERAQRDRALREEVRRLKSTVAGEQGFEEILGDSAPMKQARDLIARVADSDTSVLITGESGTGKELVARAIHARSARKAGPFVAINCAAMPEALLESELFGHVKGAFTDARQTRAGLFVQASRGTLFLDEIGDMPPGMQAKLLRAIQERTVRPVGGDSQLAFDTRILAATHRDLETDVDKKRFREDLFYRVNVVTIHVPPLRERGSDVLLLAKHFLERAAGQGRPKITSITREAANKLVEYPWPGNVRELQNCFERAVALSLVAQLDVEGLPERIRHYVPARIVIDDFEHQDTGAMFPMAEIERRYILKVLTLVGGNKTRAAEILRVDRRTMYRKLESYGVGADEPSVRGARVR